MSSHILDTTLGRPAAGVVLTFSRLVNNHYEHEHDEDVDEHDEDVDEEGDEVPIQ